MLRNGPNGTCQIGGVSVASATRGGRASTLDGDDSAAVSDAASRRFARSDEPKRDLGDAQQVSDAASRQLAQCDAPGLLSLPRLSHEALAELGRDELLAVLSDVERFVNGAAGYRARVLGALDALSRSGAAPDASPHLTLRDAAGLSERDARRTARMAEKARAQPTVLEALCDGDINTAQAEALCDARVPGGVREDLVTAAASEDTDATRRRVRQAEADHCVETSMERFERQRKARGAGWQRDHDGMLRLWAKLDPHTGARIEAMLEPLRRELWADDKQIRDGRRSPAQRDADVLAYALAGVTGTDTDAAAVDRLLARAGRRQRQPERNGPTPSRRTTQRQSAADHGDGRTADGARAKHNGHANDNGRDGLRGCSDSTRRLPPAQISVLIELDALRGRADKMGLTDAGTELPPEIVRQLACDAEIIPMILGGPGGPADIGRASRTVSRRLRRLLVARDRRCRWPGCSAPPSRCDAHHIIHWLNGGPTNLDNLALLCHTHHQHLHTHGYRIILTADHSVTVAQEPEPAPPDGTARPRGP